MTDATYELLDSGDGRKLEQVGPYRLVRPAPQAVWRPRLDPERWAGADAEFIRREGEEGGWRGTPLPERWPVTLAPLTFLIQATGFGHLGLFPEQREGWGWIADRVREAAARLERPPRVLNLFAYTGTATVYAAAGGATSTSSVDMSRTYLDWARRNLALNGYSDARHHFIQADCLEWIKQAAQEKMRYGLIFLDPPSFSNSARMDASFDVQRDHATLLIATARLLAPNGVLIFSNNLRSFKLDQPALAGLQIEDITQATIPEDFARNPRIHNCWKITSDAPSKRA